MSSSHVHTKTSIIHFPELIYDLNTGLNVYIDKCFYSNKESNLIYKTLSDSIGYNKDTQIKMYGKIIEIPRKQTAYGDPGTSYNFSGNTIHAKEWHPIILKIKNDIEFLTKLKFNFCLVNRYEDGTNYIGYHKDATNDLEHFNIASVSFGSERKFYLKCNDSGIVKKISLNSGCLCIMLDPTNTYYKHSVPKETKVKKPRINLTFRKMKIN